MNRLHILLLVTIGLILGACGTNTKEDKQPKTYDMWEYMTPTSNIEVEYNLYENGQKVNYSFETIKLLSSNVVEQTDGNEVTILTAHANTIDMHPQGKERIEVQRSVKIGDTNIFKAANLSCKIVNHIPEEEIKNFTFYDIIKVTCQKGNIYREIYYGYQEGIVSFYENSGGYITEKIKVRETKL